MFQWQLGIATFSKKRKRLLRGMLTFTMAIADQRAIVAHSCSFGLPPVSELNIAFALLHAPTEKKNIASDCDSVCKFPMKKRAAIAVWLATGTFATENRSHDLQLRFLVLSALRRCTIARHGFRALGSENQNEGFKWGLKATLRNLRTIVYKCAFCGPFGPCGQVP